MRRRPQPAGAAQESSPVGPIIASPPRICIGEAKCRRTALMVSECLGHRLKSIDQTGNRHRGWDLTLHLVEMVIWWPSLPAPILHTTMAQSRSQNEPRRVLNRPRTCARRSDATDARTEARRCVGSIRQPPEHTPDLPTRNRFTHGRSAAELTVFSRLVDPISRLPPRYLALRSRNVGFGP
jgi:hypothetical protein